MKVYLSKDPGTNLQVAKVAKYLNSRCSFVKFGVLSPSFNIVEKEIVHPETHEKYLKNISTKLGKNDFIVHVTDIPYDNNYYYEEKNKLVILSLFGWEYITDLPKENGLVYFICGMLLEEILSFDEIDHTRKTGCVNDFLYDKTRVVDGMKKGSMCNRCKNYLNRFRYSENQLKSINDVNVLLKELSIASNSERNLVTNKLIRNTPPVDYKVENKSKGGKNKKISVFISYSHKDDKYRQKLENHLMALRRLNMIDIWSDRRISPGDEWKKEIDNNLTTSDIILLLISDSFIASDYCNEIEMKTALKRNKRKEAVAISIILSECFWQESPFAKLQLLPSDNKSIEQFSRKNQAYTIIAKSIYELIREKYSRFPTASVS